MARNKGKDTGGSGLWLWALVAIVVGLPVFGVASLMFVVPVLVEAVKGLFTSAKDNSRDAGKAAADGVKEAVTEAANDAKEAAEAQVQDWYNWGLNQLGYGSGAGTGS